MVRDILEGPEFTRADGADVWTAVHRRLPDAWPQVFRPPGHERLVGVEWRVWAANSPCPPVVVLPRRTSHPSWETVAVLWGWVAVRGTGGHVFTAPRGTVIETDGGTALQLTAEPLTTHVVVAVLQWGADKPQPWRDPVARAVWRDLPVLRAAVWPGGAGRHLPSALPWLRDCGDASPPPAELRGALEHLYSKPRHHLLVAVDHGVELSDDVVAWQPTWCSGWPPTPCCSRGRGGRASGTTKPPLPSSSRGTSSWAAQRRFTWTGRRRRACGTERLTTSWPLPRS